MKRLLLLALPLFVYGEDLKSLLEHAAGNNELVVSKEYVQKAKQKELSSAQSSYYPTIDANAFYERDDEATPFRAGTTYGAAVSVGLDIYDGGKKSYTNSQKKEELNAASFSYKDSKKSMLLSIAEDFYNLKTLHASLDARVEASIAVKAQLERMLQFYDAKLATSDDVDRLQSAYDSNIYAIESLKFEIESLRSSLELRVGKKIESLDDSKFMKSLKEEKDELDSIQALKSNKKALINAGETIDSYYYPNIRLEDTYTVYGYQDEPNMNGVPIPLLDNQNKLMATMSLRLVDFGVLGEQKAAAMLQAQALNEQILYKSKEQMMQLSLAVKRIKTAELNIKSSQSALKSATSALETITKKYNAGIVDNVVYLDALSSNTLAKALKEKSINDLEIAYAKYYYYNAKNIEEFLQ